MRAELTAEDNPLTRMNANHEDKLSRPRHSSVIRKSKIKKNGRRRSLSCDELAMYRNRAASPACDRSSSQNSRQKENKKTYKRPSRQRSNTCFTANTNSYVNNANLSTKEKKTAPPSRALRKFERKLSAVEDIKKPTKLTKKIYFPINSLLHYAVAEGDLRLVARLLSCDSNGIDNLSIDGTAPVHEAAINGDLSCIGLLLAYGADLETKDRHNRTAVEYAVLAGHFDCASFLLDSGANDEKIRHGVPCS